MIFVMGITLCIVSAFVEAINKELGRGKCYYRVARSCFSVFCVGVIMAITSILKVIWVNMP